MLYASKWIKILGLLINEVKQTFNDKTFWIGLGNVGSSSNTDKNVINNLINVVLWSRFYAVSLAWRNKFVLSQRKPSINAKCKTLQFIKFRAFNKIIIDTQLKILLRTRYIWNKLYYNLKLCLILKSGRHFYKILFRY